MDLQLNGKRALVSGSTGGIGEAIARTLAAEGAAVVVHGRRETEAARVAREIGAAGGRTAVAIGDLADDAAADAVADKILRELGGVDILVNNAGVFPLKPWLETTAAEWVGIYDQNVGSMVRLIRRLVPGMKERGWGRIIAIASGVATLPIPSEAAYSASKAAVLNLAVSLARELTGTGVTSNAVSPGPVVTAGVRELLLQMAAQKGWGQEWAEIERRFIAEVAPNPAGRMGRLEEIADVVAFLASPRAGYVNGANVRVDGGYVPTVN